MNIILDKIKPYIEKITEDNQNGVRVGGSVICTENNKWESLGKHSECTKFIYWFSKGLWLYT